MGQREWVSGATVSSSLRAVGPNLVGCIRGRDKGVVRETQEDTELVGWSEGPEAAEREHSCRLS